MNRAIAAAAASPRPALPPSTCRAAARRCALRCRDGVSISRHYFLPSSSAKAGDPVRRGFCRYYNGHRVLDARLRGHDSGWIMTKTPRPFTDIDTWVFDLDNTLYPHHVNLWQQVDERIGEFVSRWLKVSAEEARRI